MNEDTKIKKYDILKNVIFIGIFVLILIALFRKCRYGSPASTDEAFYPTIAHRLLQGDRLLYDEWHVTQLSAVVIMPVLKLYMMLNGSTDGVYLALRYLYTALKILISIFIYFRLKKYNRFGAYMSSVIFLIYAGFGIMAVSYNNISVGGVLCALLLLINEKDGVKTRIYWVLAGIALSVGVLGIPYNAFLYIAYAAAVAVVSYVVKKRERAGKDFQNKTVALCYSYKAFGFVTIGVGICLCVFLVYLFRTVTLQQIMESMPYILTQDVEHPPKNILVAALKYPFWVVALCSRGNYVARLVYAVLVVIFGIYIFDKKRKKHITWYIAVFSIMSIVLLATLIITENHINYIIFVPNVLAVILLIILRDELYQTMSAMIIVPGIVLGYAEYLASNTGPYGIAAVSCVATVGSVLIIISATQRYVRDKVQNGIDRKVVCTAMCVFVSAIIVSLAYYRMIALYGGESLNMQEITIETGPAKGLKVSVKYSEMYEKVLSDTEQIRNMSNDTKVVFVGNSFLWMTSEQRCGTYTTYISKVDYLKKYYEIQPDKIADVIYVQDGYGENIVEELIEIYGYDCTRLSGGWMLEMKYMSIKQDFP